MSSQPGSELHHRLRQATRGPHHDLDHHPILAALIRPDLGLSEYGKALSALHGVYSVAELWILDYLSQHSVPFDYALRRKLPALESDLAELGRNPISAQMEFAAEQRLGALVGVLYTIEGSTLGGQFIARSLSKIEGVAWPTAFFSGYGNLSHQRWQAYLSFADACCPKAEYDLAAATAAFLFQSIKNHLDRVS